MQPQAILDLLVWFVVFVFSTTVHEFGHAWAAHLGGDSTAYEGGQVSLDPLPHIKREPVGMVILPLLSFVFMGWMMGYASAPYDPRWAERHPKRYAWMSLAGPLGNFLLSAAAFVLIVVLVKTGSLTLSASLRIDGIVEPVSQVPGSLWGAVAKTLSVLFSLNLLLGVFNLMPILPMDGAAVLEGFFPETAGQFFQKMRMSPGMGFLGLIIAWNIFPWIFSPIFKAALLLLLLV